MLTERKHPYLQKEICEKSSKLNFISENVLSFHYCIYSYIKMLINGLKSSKTTILASVTYVISIFFNP